MNENNTENLEKTEQLVTTPARELKLGDLVTFCVRPDTLEAGIVYGFNRVDISWDGFKKVIDLKVIKHDPSTKNKTKRASYYAKPVTIIDIDEYAADCLQFVQNVEKMALRLDRREEYIEQQRNRMAEKIRILREVAEKIKKYV
jgi:hypothetical protein